MNRENLAVVATLLFVGSIVIVLSLNGLVH